ncbi:hypothetical protein [Pantoea agglomerans]|uniref:hypothetical protein n=1 Tax=Enterobacter agglomerans TaxID=549 RepID=UPI002B1D5DD4|nr:hypothetical protein [Pantoea agglomerans]
MSKQVTAILPGDVVQKITVSEEDDMAFFIGENGSNLGLPVKKYILDDQEYFIATYDDLPDERIERAIKTGK